MTTHAFSSSDFLNRVRPALALTLAIAAFGMAHATDPRTGALVGGAVGAAGGAVIGQQAGGTTGAVVGAAVGAGLGAAIGASVSDGHAHPPQPGRYPPGSTGVGTAPIYRGAECASGSRRDGCEPPGQRREHDRDHGHGHGHGHGHRK